MTNIILLVWEEREERRGIFSAILLDIDCPWLSPGLWYNTIPPARPRVSTTLPGEISGNWFTVSGGKKIIILAKHSALPPCLCGVLRAGRCQIGSWLILTWLDASSPAQPWLAHLFSYAGQKAGLDLCKYDGSDGSDGSQCPTVWPLTSLQRSKTRSLAAVIISFNGL